MKKVLAVRCTIDLNIDEKHNVADQERTITFYIRECPITQIKKFFNSSKELFAPQKLANVEVIKEFNTDKEAFQYYNDHFHLPGYHSWGIIIIPEDDNSKTP